MSSATLLRGVELTRAATMSLESDPQYLAMMAEKQKLLASRSQPIPTLCFVNSKVEFFEGNVPVAPLGLAGSSSMYFF